jgi:Putative Ig domain.
MTKRIVLALVLSAGVLLIPATQQTIGPWVGLRIPVYDNLKRGQSQPYWFFKMDPTQFQLTPDPASTSDGILNIKLPPPPPVVPTLEIVAILPNAYVGVMYSQSLVAAGGAPPYIWKVAEGTVLPPGFTFTSSGVLSGKATAPGSYPVTVTVTDANQVSRTLTFTSAPVDVGFAIFAPDSHGTFQVATQGK